MIGGRDKIKVSDIDCGVVEDVLLAAVADCVVA